jgi:biotin carboxyl carrier protein
MFVGRDGQISIRCTLAGWVELRTKVGDRVAAGQLVAIVEGEKQLESLSVAASSEVVELCVEDGAEIPAGTTLMKVVELEY